MLEYHPHFLAVPVYIRPFVQNIRPIKNNMSLCGFFQTVETS